MNNYKPAFGLHNRHLQTIHSTFFRKKETLDFEIEKFILSDGDFLEAYWLNKPKKNDNKPIVIIFHGLQGSYLSPYINGIMSLFSKSSFSCVLMHFRSCSGVMNDKLSSYHSGKTDDAREFVSSVKKRFTSNNLFALGYSVGGNVLLKLLGEDGKSSPFKSAISICAPLDLRISVGAISQGFSRIYEYKILQSLKKDLLLKYEIYDIEKVIGLKKEDVSKIRNIREFDESYTSKVFGFETSQNYYKLCSSKPFLKSIQVDTLLIHSIDDPFMNKDILPSKTELSSKVNLELYPHGGHIGFISGSIFKPIYWLDQKIINHFKNYDEQLT